VSKLSLPHVLHTFDTLDDRGRRILNVATDLPISPGSSGFNAEALHALNARLFELIDPRRGYDEVKIHSAD
jgi:hypothetical protein